MAVSGANARPSVARSLFELAKSLFYIYVVMYCLAAAAFDWPLLTRVVWLGLVCIFALAGSRHAERIQSRRSDHDATE